MTSKSRLKRALRGVMPLAACCVFVLCAPVNAQVSFGSQQVITTGADSAFGVFAADIDGDGDPDTLSASYNDGKIAWYENLGGSFGPQQVITTSAYGARCVHAADLDGDGDTDVLSASYNDDKIAWYENLGNGTFGSQQVLNGPAGTPTSADAATSVHAADLDGDGDVDVLSSSFIDDKIAWYENLGGGAFASQQVISSNANGARNVHTGDLDGDGDPDVLSANYSDDMIAWHENLGGGAFGPRQVISTSADGVNCVRTADIDGDGDNDVLASSYWDNKIAWYENLGAGNGLGGGSFGFQKIITTNAHYANSVVAADLDGDGDPDVLSSSHNDDKIAWYENPGTGGSFGPEQIITVSAFGAECAFAADLDGDGDADVLSASYYDDKIAWYENLVPPHPGSGEDFELSTGINGAPTATPGIKTATVGDTLTVHIQSPGSTYDSTSIILAAELFPTGGPPPVGPAPFSAELHITLAGLIVVGPGTPLNPVLAPGGNTYQFTIPAITVPNSVMLQALALTFGPPANNGFFATTNGHEIQIQ